MLDQTAPWLDDDHGSSGEEEEVVTPGSPEAVLPDQSAQNSSQLKAVNSGLNTAGEPSPGIPTGNHASVITEVKESDPLATSRAERNPFCEEYIHTEHHGKSFATRSPI